jgi:8-amino-7-oxononanoate synthase
MKLAIYFHAQLSPLLLRTPRSVLTLPPSSDAPFPNSTNPFLPSNPLSPIIGLLTPAPHALSSFLLARGFIVRPVVPPTLRWTRMWWIG